MPALTTDVFYMTLIQMKPASSHTMHEPRKSQATKKVQSIVEMVPACRKVLRSVCEINNTTVTNYLYDTARLEIHKQAVCCPMVERVLRVFNKDIDQRVYKPCAGFHCQLCAHRTACAAGKTDQLFTFADHALKSLEEGGYEATVTYEEVTRIEPKVTIQQVVA